MAKHILLAHKWGTQQSQEQLDACLHSLLKEFILLHTLKHKGERENGNFTLWVLTFGDKQKDKQTDSRQVLEYLPYKAICSSMGKSVCGF